MLSILPLQRFLISQLQYRKQFNTDLRDYNQGSAREEMTQGREEDKWGTEMRGEEILSEK